MAKFERVGDGLDGFFEVLALARETLETIDESNDEVSEAVSAVRVALLNLNEQIRPLDKEISEPNVLDYSDIYGDDWEMALAIKKMAKVVVDTFCERYDWQAFDALIDALE